MKDLLRQPGPSELQLRALAIVDKKKRIYVSHVRRLVGNSEAAADVLQDLRVEILRSRTLPRAEDELARYLYGMLTKVAYQWRLKHRSPFIEHCECPEAHLQLVEEALSEDASADADFGPADIKFRTEFLRQRAGELSPKSAQVFTKVACEGASQQAVAAQMGTALATVKTHYQRAMKAVQKFLRGGRS